ncbi:hypothetical protein EJ06DRAFT_274927 [Trichodelitschia bisporula]|uniref:R3H-associated N-terminal domain-containing protein n=1 Tax=Trichodelitschia bisporula TaxID=703511 RepID=A0A6G1I5N6_9PEZI|nr:hypothetical protein EJ06DRAFT_274927 [Trichodelitschia bisporula]
MQPIIIPIWSAEVLPPLSDLSLSDSEPPSPAPQPIQRKPNTYDAATAAAAAALLRKRERDSFRRREALLEGREGTRRRRRWENDRLLGNPHATPPLPTDWAVPTPPTHTVPYYLAPLWEAGLASISAARLERERARKKAALEAAAAAPVQGGNVAAVPPGHVPRELRVRLRKARGARGLLRDVEGEVRGFVAERLRAQEVGGESEDESVVFVGRDGESEDEEMVFVGQDGEMSLGLGGRMERAIEADGPFARWVVHAVGAYYGLRTWSVEGGEGRCVWVGVREGGVGFLPRPLWAVV